jgi:hypothetical protein
MIYGRYRLDQHFAKNRVIKLDPFSECLQNAALKFRRSPSDLTCL